MKTLTTALVMLFGLFSMMVLMPSADADEAKETKTIRIAEKDKAQDGRGLLLPTWAEKLGSRDSSGVARNSAIQRQEWERNEEKREQWGLKNTHGRMYASPTEEEKAKSIKKSLLRFSEKKVTEEDDENEENKTEAAAIDKNKREEKSAMAKALSSKSSAVEGDDVKVKVKTKPTSAKAQVDMSSSVLNSTVEVNALSKDVNLHTYRQFKKAGVQTGAKYQIAKDNYETYIDKSLAPNLLGRISSTQESDQKVFSKESDKKVEVIYSVSF